MEEEYHPHSHSKLPSSSGHHGGRHHSPASTEQLLDSVKVVASAAKSAISHHSVSEIDKARVAEAAEDLLDAAKRYGKLEGSEIGDYINKAEEYLHNLHSSQSHHPQDHRPTPQDDEEEED